MTTGFEVRRNDGKEAVSSIYPHYCFIKKIRLSATVHWWDTSGQQYSDHVIVAFRQVDSTKLNVGRFSKGRQILWNEFSPAPPPTSATLSLFSYEVADAYIFDVAPTTPANRYGLQVFNEAGVCTFDASRRFMRIVDVIQDNAPVSTNPWVGSNPFKRYSYPVDHKLAVIPLKEGYHVVYSRDSEQMYGKTWQRVFDGGVDVYMNYFYEDGGTTSEGSRRHLQFTTVVIDVSHLDVL